MFAERMIAEDGPNKITLVHCIYLVGLGLSVLCSLLPDLVQSRLECKCAFYPCGSLYCSGILTLRHKPHAVHMKYDDRVLQQQHDRLWGCSVNLTF